MRARWSGNAISDLIEIRNYIRKDSPLAASDVARRIKAAVEMLKEHPAMGSPGRVEGTRELVIPGLPYIIPYRVKESTIEILRVFHGARKWTGTI